MCLLASALALSFSGLLFWHVLQWMIPSTRLIRLMRTKYICVGMWAFVYQHGEMNTHLRSLPLIQRKLIEKSSNKHAHGRKYLRMIFVILNANVDNFIWYLIIIITVVVVVVVTVAAIFKLTCTFGYIPILSTLCHFLLFCAPFVFSLHYRIRCFFRVTVANHSDFPPTWIFVNQKKNENKIKFVKRTNGLGTVEFLLVVMVMVKSSGCDTCCVLLGWVHFNRSVLYTVVVAAAVAMPLLDL